MSFVSTFVNSSPQVLESSPIARGCQSAAPTHGLTPAMDFGLLASQRGKARPQAKMQEPARTGRSEGAQIYAK